MKIAVLLAAAVLMTAAAEAPTLTQAERDKAIAEFEGSRQAFLDATKGLSPEQWNFKPAPERWSVAECAEHIALSEGFLFGLVSEKIMKSPAAPEKREAAKGKDELVMKFVLDRTQKAKAPEPVDPAKHPMTPEESLKVFSESRARSIEYIKTTQEDLRDHFYDLPAPTVGTLDAYQWLLFLSGHSRRHTAQILEVKGDPKFPKK